MLELLLMATIPYDDTLTVHCDTQEVNYVYDCAGPKPLCHLRQLIVRNHDEVIDWRANRRPVYDWERRCHRATWIENGRVIEVRSPVMIESWTEYDRELECREWLPICARKRIVP